jgi:hypothetical protein
VPFAANRTVNWTDKPSQLVALNTSCQNASSTGTRSLRTLAVARALPVSETPISVRRLGSFRKKGPPILIASALAAFEGAPLDCSVEFIDENGG